MCLYPSLIKNRKYTANKKNRGQVPPVSDPRVLYVATGCGNCIECMKQKTRQWQVRLLEDIKQHTNGKMISLTFSNESIAALTKDLPPVKGYLLDNEIARLATRRWLERWRKKYKKSLRHWLVTELGHAGTENIHLHGIVWTDKQPHDILDKWQYGFIWPKDNNWKDNYVNESTISYITKYITKIDEDHKFYKPKILTSPGIGSNFINTTNARHNNFNGTKTKEYYKTNTGHKISLPTYYRNKLYNDDERERLWLQRLDKEERWICGEKITTHGDYWETLKWHRKRNIELGYGDNSINWDRKEYEEIRRQMLQMERISASPAGQ